MLSPFQYESSQAHVSELRRQATVARRDLLRQTRAPRWLRLRTVLTGSTAGTAGALTTSSAPRVIAAGQPQR